MWDGKKTVATKIMQDVLLKIKLSELARIRKLPKQESEEAVVDARRHFSPGDGGDSLEPQGT